MFSTAVIHKLPMVLVFVIKLKYERNKNYPDEDMERKKGRILIIRGRDGARGKMVHGREIRAGWKNDQKKKKKRKTKLTLSWVNPEINL